MRKKLKGWQKTVLSYVSLFLVFAVAAGCFVFLSASPDKKFGIESGIIEHSKIGQNITDSVLNSGAPTTVLSNDKLSVNLSADGNVSVTNLQTGRVWSTAVDTADESKFGQGFNETHSLFSVTYVNELNAEAEWTAYEQCVKKKQLQILKVDDNKIRLDFILGESSTDQLIPSALTKERFEEDILPKLGESDAEFMKRQYKLYDADKLTAEDNPDSLFKDYPELKKTPLYISKGLSSKMIKQKLTKVYEKIGYTAEDYDRDNKLTGFGASSVTYTYKVAIDLSLDDDGLVISIPKEDIEFYRAHPLLKISLMKFFASGTDNASVLVPSGSGAITTFNKGGNSNTYRCNVYGDDLTLNPRTMPTVMDGDSNLTFPIFSLRQGSDVLTAVIDSGAANAALCYNSNAESMYCYYDFTVVQSDRAYIDAKNNVLQYGNDVISEDISVKYIFGSCDTAQSDETVFSDIACDYRAALEKDGMLSSDSSQVSKTPALLLEMLGNVTVKKDFIGLFPVNSTLTLTDFEKAVEMLDWFSEKTKGNLAVSLKGWNKDGLYRQASGKVSYSSQLGGQKGYKAFEKATGKMGITPYYAAEHTVFLNDALFDGYKKSNTAKFVDGSLAVAKAYTSVEGGYFGTGNISITSPSKYRDIADGYIKDGVKAVNLSTFGVSLNSDYDLPYFDRSRTQKAVVDTLAAYKKSDVKIAVEDANLYAVKYCDRIEDMPIKAGKNSVFTKSFPFKQIVLHGSIDYTAKIDFGVAEADSNLLTAIAMGSGIKAALSYQNSDYSLPSYYSDIYTTDFKTNREKIAEYANTVFEALDGLGKERIVSFESSGTVSKTLYSNGTAVYVNTGDVDAQFDTVTVGAKSYLRINK